MCRWRKTLVVWLGSLGLVTLGGCGGGGPSDPPAAAIDGGQPAADGQQDADPHHPVVVLDTSLGQITLRLDAEKAPITVANFLSYVGSGHYDQTIFHQVTKGRIIIGGAYGADLVERRTSIGIRNEAHNGLKNRRGTIAMARQPEAIDGATSQFFINLADNPALDHKDRTPEGYGYCVFGEVVEGLDVVDRIAALAVHDTERLQQTPVQPVAIRSARRAL